MYNCASFARWRASLLVQRLAEGNDATAASLLQPTKPNSLCKLYANDFPKAARERAGTKHARAASHAAAASVQIFTGVIQMPRVRVRGGVVVVFVLLHLAKGALVPQVEAPQVTAKKVERAG